MKRNLLLISSLFFVSLLLQILVFKKDLGWAAFSQSQNYIWAKSVGGKIFDEAFSVASDSGGNSYIVGAYISASITFGSITLLNADTDYTKMFIVKYDANGNALWGKGAGGTGWWDRANSVAVDIYGNCYVTGLFGSPSISFGSTTLSNAGDYDIFIVKYSPNGNVLWAKSAGGSNDDRGNSITTDKDGNCYVTGEFNSSTLTFGSTILNYAGGGDIFLVKFDTSGNVIWAKSSGGYAIIISVDINNNIYLGGSFSNANLIIDSITLINAGAEDMFLMKYDSSGNVLWAKSAGGSSYERTVSVSVDLNGNSYVAGYFQSTNILFGSTTLSTSGYDDVFIAKYDSNGDVLWAKSAGGNQYDYASSVVTDVIGNCYVAGSFASFKLTFGSITLFNANFAFTSDMFLVKYSPNGNVLWAKSAGGGGTDDYAISVATDFNDNLFILGWFNSDSITFGSTTLKKAGESNIFLTKLSGTTGIESISNSPNISIYPNPFNSKAIIEFKDTHLSNSPLEVFIYDVFGREVKHQQIKQVHQEIVIEKGNLLEGMYFYKVQENGKIIGSGKVVVR